MQFQQQRAMMMVPRRRPAGMGIISIPNNVVWWQADISAFYNVILNAVSQLSQEIQANVPNTGDGATLRTEFTAFKNHFLSQWQQYHNSWGPSSGSSAAVSAAHEAASRYNAFEGRYTALTGRPPPPSGLAPVPEQQGPAMFLGQPLWVWGVAGGGAIVALGLVGWMVSSVGKTAAAFSPAALLHNPRRRHRPKRARRAR